MDAQHRPEIVLNHNQLQCACSCGQWVHDIREIGSPRRQEPVELTLYHHWMHTLEQLSK